MRRLLRATTLAADLVRARFQTADIAVFYTFVPPPYGGGNQFLRALWDEWQRRGWRLENNTVSPTTRACVFNSFNFDRARLRRFRRDGCRMVHRVDGPVSVYRGSDDAIDRRIAAMNAELADVTVFQSEYSRRRHQDMGLTFTNPHVIRNAADPLMFHPPASPRPRGERIRLITTSWSDNPNKGAAVFKWLEAHLDWQRFDLTFVGRSAVAFERIHTLPPVPSRELADLLRTHDVFISASQHEACSNALIEALSCGLPAIYIDSGANREIVGDAGLAFTAAEELPALLDRMAGELEAFRARISPPSIAAVADAYLQVMGLPARPAAR